MALFSLLLHSWNSINAAEVATFLRCCQWENCGVCALCGHPFPTCLCWSWGGSSYIRQVSMRSFPLYTLSLGWNCCPKCGLSFQKKNLSLFLPGITLFPCSCGGYSRAGRMDSALWRFDLSQTVCSWCTANILVPNPSLYHFNQREVVLVCFVLSLCGVLKIFWWKYNYIVNINLLMVVLLLLAAVHCCSECPVDPPGFYMPGVAECQADGCLDGSAGNGQKFSAFSFHSCWSDKSFQKPLGKIHKILVFPCFSCWNLLWWVLTGLLLDLGCRKAWQEEQR